MVEIIYISASLSSGSRAYVHQQLLRNLIEANPWYISGMN